MYIYGGLITILLYADAGNIGPIQNSILTEASDQILTESSQPLLIET